MSIKKMKHDFPKMRGGEVKDSMELIWFNVALSRALLGQWSKVGSLGRVYVIVVDTFEEKRRVVTIDNVDFTVYCLL